MKTKYKIGDEVYFWVLDGNRPIIDQGTITDIIAGDTYSVSVYEGLAKRNISTKVEDVILELDKEYREWIKDLQAQRAKLKPIVNKIKNKK
jgi:hypothetical protein